MKKGKDIFYNEDGGTTLVTLPFMMLVFMMLAALVLNMLLWSSKQNELQLVADSVSQAGTLGIKYQYGVKERAGSSAFDGYHVYTELDPSTADDLADKVLNESKKYIANAEITDYSYNPQEDYTFSVWNSKTFKYYEKNLTSDKQYKNGNFSVYIKSDIHGIWENLIGVSDTLKIETYSQSAAKGSVTGYK